MGSCGLIMLDKVGGMDLISWFPCVVALGISFPFDQVLEPFRPSELSVCDNSFDFVFFFSVNEIRRWSGEVWTVRSRFVIRRQEGRVKYVVDSPTRRQFKSVCYWGYLLDYPKGAQAFRSELGFLMGKFQVRCIKPYLFSEVELCRGWSFLIGNFIECPNGVCAVLSHGVNSRFD